MKRFGRLALLSALLSLPLAAYAGERALATDCQGCAHCPPGCTHCPKHHPKQQTGSPAQDPAAAQK